MPKVRSGGRRILAVILASAVIWGCFPAGAYAAGASSRYVNSTYAEVWLNMLGAVETGGQIYGNRDYSSFIGPYTSSPNEYSCTAGAYQEYGDNLRQLLLAIKKKYPSTFRKLDTANIAGDLARPWTSRNPYIVRPGSAKARAIQRIISSKQGREVQDQRALDLLDQYLRDIKKLGVKKLRCALFLAECYHLGGYAAVKRIANRATDKNRISCLKKSLYLDQKDRSNNYQIGDTIYKSRHEAAYKWLIKYVHSGKGYIVRD